MPPDRRGLLHENDVAALRGFGDLVRQTFARNLTANAKTSEHNLLDEDRYSFTTQPEVVLDLGDPVTFSIVRLRENIKLGQRIEAFELDAWRDGGWQTFAQATSVGACRIVRATVTTSRVRLRITKSPAPPALSELGLY